MSPTRRQAADTTVGYVSRLVLYAICVALPFVALLAGRLEGDQAISAVLALVAAMGPAVALTRATTERKVERKAYADGLEVGLELDEPPHGRHRLEDRDDDERRQ